MARQTDHLHTMQRDAEQKYFGHETCAEENNYDLS